MFCRNAKGCEPRHAGDSSIVLWNCPLLIRRGACTALDCMRVPMGAETSLLTLSAWETPARSMQRFF